MPAQSRSHASFAALIGKPFDSLTAAERWEFAGTWVALELYTPHSMPLRLIAAAEGSPQGCVVQLTARGLDPTRFEYLPLPQPYQP